jgi:tetratricopeptide (TPR) repeat protein
MNVRLVASSVLALLLLSYASGQQTLQGGGEADPTARAAADTGTFKENLSHRIALEEAAVRQAESAHASNVALSKIYVQLGLFYQDAAQWGASEVVLRHAVSLLRPATEPREELARAISQLGSLHTLMGKLRESERECRESLKLRQSIGDRLQIARSWSDLAALSLLQSKFERARDYAQQAMAEFDTDERASALDKIAARFALARALCSINECASAVPLLKTALDEANAALRPSDFPVGLGHFLLGYAYWKSGDMSRANEYMERGTVLMNTQLGWGHPGYLKALGCYAEFLHENRNVEAANAVERRIRQAQVVVDVRSLQSGPSALGFAGVK